MNGSCNSCILIFIILLVILLYSSTNNKFTTRPRWALFIQTHIPVDIGGWLIHHYKMKPDAIYMVIENNKDLKIPSHLLSPILHIEYVYTDATGSWGNDLDDRMQRNFNRFSNIARQNNIEWMMKVDDDELLYSPSNKSIPDILSPIKSNSIRVQNYEAYFPKINKDENKCFDKNVKFLRCDTSVCTAYANGKSIGRISNPKVLQSGSHFFSGPNTSMDFISIKDLVLLHFESCTYPKWKKKFQKMNKNKEGNKQLFYSDFQGSLSDFLKKRFPHYANSLHIFDKDNVTEKELMSTYKDMRLIKSSGDYIVFPFSD